MSLTLYEALLGELEPYSPSRLTIQKAMADVQLDDTDAPYSPEKDKKPVAIAAINILKKMVVLTNDSLGKSSQGYSVDQLINRIKDICSENGLDASDYVEVSSITDGSNLW